MLCTHCLVWLFNLTDISKKEKQEFIFFKAIWQDVTYYEAGIWHFMCDERRYVQKCTQWRKWRMQRNFARVQDLRE